MHNAFTTPRCYSGVHVALALALHALSIDHFRNDVMQHTRQNTLPVHSLIKLHVKVQVDWSGGPLNRLEGVIWNGLFSWALYEIKFVSSSLRLCLLFGPSYPNYPKFIYFLLIIYLYNPLSSCQTGGWNTTSWPIDRPFSFTTPVLWSSHSDLLLGPRRDRLSKSAIVSSLTRVAAQLLFLHWVLDLMFFFLLFLGWPVTSSTIDFAWKNW